MVSFYIKAARNSGTCEKVKAGERKRRKRRGKNEEMRKTDGGKIERMANR